MKGTIFERDSDALGSAKTLFFKLFLLFAILECKITTHDQI